ncbi:MAG: carboxypeptidase regulatory-like domain-containing protein, partial [Terracidiphilus sp.]
MRFIRLQNAVLALSLLAMTGLVATITAPIAHAQNAVTGAISGEVSDGSGAVVPGATVTVVDTSTNAQQVVKTNAEGRYTVASLKPGLYKVTASAESLKSDTLEVTVILGTLVPGDIKVTPTGNNTIVEVTSTSLPLVDTQNVALATTFNEEQIQDLPTPGGDVTTVAFTAPGVVVNAGGAYGNFSSDGLPGISNLFVLNGFDNQDPFLNLNNSGSSNLTLGQGELAEATVIQNGYNSQYGRAAGAIINYTTKSGGNKFHGMADYNYNGTVLNANGWFNEQDENLSYNGCLANGGTVAACGGPNWNVRPHAVSNEWAINTGGPIIRDKVFFFADFEGLRYVLPNSGLVTFPTPALQTYILSNIPADAQGLYGQIFAGYKSAKSYASATPVTNGGSPEQDGYGALGCGPTADGGLAGTTAPGGGTFGVNVPCMSVANATANNINKEWLFTGRGDWNISDKHKIYGRYKMDRGSQPTSTSFINPLFSAVSIQPEYEGQFNDSYVISPTKTNVLVVAANWYSAYFGPLSVSASQAALPFGFIAGVESGFDGSGVNASPGLSPEGVPYYLTQGRNVTQYQIEDDFSWILGKHTLKIGANFRRDLVEDYDSQIETVFPFPYIFTLPGLAAGNLGGGGNGLFFDAFTSTPTAHLALYNLGAYFQDEFQATPKLKLTLGFRIDRTGNPLCHGGCFSLYEGSFPSSNAGPNGAYSSADGGPVNPMNYHPFPAVQAINFQPRFGFNYSFNDKNEVRGGVGLFSDLYPAGFADGVIDNFPNYNAVEVLSGDIASSGSGTMVGNAAAANSALVGGFKAGESVTAINNNLTAQNVPFTPPSITAYFPSTFKVPEYLEYSLQFQRQLTKSQAIIVTYAGNYGYDGVIINPYVNASDETYDNPSGTWLPNPAGSLGLTVTPADPRFSRVTGFTNNGHSNYNGGMVTYKHNGHGVTGQVSYTYSHSLDMV